MEEKDVKTSAEDIKNVKNEQENNSGMDINSDSDVPGSTHLSDAMADMSFTEKLEQDLAEMKDKYIRQAAEFDNYKRRTAKERMELIQTAGKDIMTSLLTVLDDCDRAQKQIDASEDNNLKEGVTLVFNKLRGALQAKGLKLMVSKGEEFNPDLHEAITEIPAPTPDLAGKVLDEVTKGYYLGDKIIRHAQVVVGK
ncbi:nucleotide exchange factor GrpE [Pinibacter aurantiacus]|uniref:Protein GrpE n=1 Tax=Pinibacter aurantiacus TaxID=2851599 RepID=A0A9E2S5J1_9BACT|nr:nucleotide exchange factor GrpE [Pinibacter aurantiacus]MBV4357038.1 nucleotide exchange factor GrpE [Pinibacter aurantiacus]